MKHYDKRDFPLWNLHLYVTTFQHHMELLSFSWYMSRYCGSYEEFLDRGLVLSMKLLNHGFLSVKLKFFPVTTMTWLTVTDICLTNDHGYVPLVVSTTRSFPHLWLNTGFVIRLRRRISLVSWCYSILVLCVVICRSLFVLVSFFGHCVVLDLRILIIPLVSSNSFYCANFQKNKNIK